ncbi:MAG: signal recognition particle protein Srp19 [Candidatus Bathyarchaeota archaeon]|jgi:signal recognition particle subunit SRP19|nr:MAG: signal recognition particle protein Srp19 [Candidatus Bathyarchaeota archaeon]
MRKQRKIAMWPVYFDLSKTRKEGRKVAKNAAVLNPSLAELQKAASNLNLNFESDTDSGHPAIPWRRTGRIWVEKVESKKRTLLSVGKELASIRQKK